MWTQYHLRGTLTQDGVDPFGETWKAEKTILLFNFAQWAPHLCDEISGKLWWSSWKCRDKAHNIILWLWSDRGVRMVSFGVKQLMNGVLSSWSWMNSVQMVSWKRYSKQVLVFFQTHIWLTHMFICYTDEALYVARDRCKSERKSQFTHYLLQPAGGIFLCWTHSHVLNTRGYAARRSHTVRGYASYGVTKIKTKDEI